MAGRERRRAELLDDVEERAWIDRPVLELAYDLAEEEDLDTAIALELVGCGVAVVELEPPARSVAGEAHSLTAPDWVAPPAEPADVLVLERRLRLTFRRFRALLEQHRDPAAAIEALAEQVDAQPYDYTAPVF
ncbi:MAG TPA: hypothetical protein VK864_08600 [Longimicrobiales bacterium]|nr:hypothetical protein [Longimicrobiales bacterium]